MRQQQDQDCTRVTYRATTAGGAEVSIQAAVSPEAATLATAWATLTSKYGEVDPYSLEIETREQSHDGRAVGEAAPDKRHETATG